MFLEAFKITAPAVAQVLLLALIGYFLKKRNTLSDEGLDALSTLTVDITLPVLIFCQLVKGFDFRVYPDWWVFPLISIAITALGLAVGFIFIGFIKGRQKKLQFLNLVAFQNSGFLPLALIVSLLPAYKTGTMLIYLFLFLIGFNLVMWPLSVYILSCCVNNRPKLRTIFNAPLLASLLGLACVAIGINKFLPDTVIKPLRMLGDCTLPLAMLIVGADLAKLSVKTFDQTAVIWMSFAKLIILPAIGLWAVFALRLPELIGLLIMIELCVPPATLLSSITRAYKHDDVLISQGIFFGHILGLVTMPVFLSLYFARVMIK